MKFKNFLGPADTLYSIFTDYLSQLQNYLVTNILHTNFMLNKINKLNTNFINDDRIILCELSFHCFVFVLIIWKHEFLCLMKQSSKSKTKTCRYKKLLFLLLLLHLCSFIACKARSVYFLKSLTKMVF